MLVVTSRCTMHRSTKHAQRLFALALPAFLSAHTRTQSSHATLRCDSPRFTPSSVRACTYTHARAHREPLSPPPHTQAHISVHNKHHVNTRVVDQGHSHTPHHHQVSRMHAPLASTHHPKRSISDDRRSATSLAFAGFGDAPQLIPNPSHALEKGPQRLPTDLHLHLQPITHTPHTRVGVHITVCMSMSMCRACVCPSPLEGFLRLPTPPAARHTRRVHVAVCRRMPEARYIICVYL